MDACAKYGALVLCCTIYDADSESLKILWPNIAMDGNVIDSVWFLLSAMNFKVIFAMDGKVVNVMWYLPSAMNVKVKKFIKPLVNGRACFH